MPVAERPHGAAGKHPHARPPRTLSLAQLDQLFSAAPDTTPMGLRDLAILETFYSAALRLAEARQLDLADLDLGEGSLKVRRGKAGSARSMPGKRPLSDRCGPLAKKAGFG